MQLNDQQQQARDLILKTGRDVFVSGFAGTGKTALLREVVRALRNQGRQVRVVAFTGLAAQHLGGTTISKLLALGLSRSLRDMKRVNLERATRNLRLVTDLVVDEISMVSGDFLELMDVVMQLARSDDRPFGGVRMIFGGDFMQLPPIHTDLDTPPTMPWAFEYPEFQKSMAIFLTQSMRQTTLEEIDILNQFRQGHISQLGRDCLNSMVGRKLDNPVDLYPLRRDVEAINKARLSRHPGDLQIYPTTARPVDQQDLLLSHVPIGKAVELKVDVPVIVLMNDPWARFVNGSQGRVHRLFRDRVVVELNSGNLVEVPHKRWEILGTDGNLLGEVHGVPLQLGWAATIHRAQGMTLDAVVTDVARCWEAGQAYVALSRTRNLHNVSLLRPVTRISADPVALSYVNHLF
jgi:ATP-dependent DNA helicase PIF1